MKAFILKHARLLLIVVLASLLGLVSFQGMSCVETSGMVIVPNQPLHECKCHGWQIKLYDHRPSDGDAKFLCVGIPE